jgi:Cd2+/Zn2+-exporting ATPase
MGNLASDVTIETADVVIQTNYPSKIVTTRLIACATPNEVCRTFGFPLL